MTGVERLALFERRALTLGETVLARFMFGDELPADRVRLFQAPRLGFGAMAPAWNLIVFSGWKAARDFASASLHERGWFVHELAHVWQRRRGVPVIAAKFAAVGGRAYRYALKPGKPFFAYNIEQQAEIARHLFLARNGAPEKDAPPVDVLEGLWPVGR